MEALVGKESVLALSHACLHELAKPMAAIHAYAELLADEVSGALGPEQHGQVDTITRNVARHGRMLDMVRDVVDLLCAPPRRTSGAVELQRVLADAIVSLRAEGVDVARLETQVVAHCALRVEGDARRLTRVVRSLLEFGCRESGGVELSSAQDSTRGFLTLDFRELCFPGDVEELFAPLGVGNGDQARAIGAGTALVRPMIEAMGGRVALSRPGEDSLRVLIELPLDGGPPSGAGS